MVSEERIVPVDMNVDKGMEFILSAGFNGKGETELKDELWEHPTDTFIWGICLLSFKGR